MSNEDLKAKMASGAIVPAAQKSASLVERVKNMSAQAVLDVLPSHIDKDRYVRAALIEIRRNPVLADCTPQSLAGAIVECARRGLEPGVGGHVFIIPRKRKVDGQWVKEATFQLGVMGTLELVRRSGQISTVNVDIVCENDQWDHTSDERGIHFQHKVNYRQSRGVPQFAYATALLKDGSTQTVIVDHDDLREARSRAAGWRDVYGNPPENWRDSPTHREWMGKVQELTGPWVEHEYAMWKKTALARLVKLLPQTSEMRELMMKENRPLHIEGNETQPVVYDEEPITDGYREDIE